MRWPFGPPHLTLKPSKKKQRNKKQKKIKNKKTKKNKREKNQKTQKWQKKKTFQLSVKFFLFWWVSKISFF